MRISIIGPAYPLRGGIAHHVYWLWQELTSRGHSVQVVSFKKLYPGLLFPGATERDRSRMKLDAGALPILGPLNPLTWLRAFKLVKAFSPDVIVIEWWQPFFGPLIGTLTRWFRRRGFARIIECHNVFPHERSPLDRVLVKYALSTADHFITHSTKDRDDLLAVLPGKNVHVSPLPVLVEFSNRNAARRDGRTILFFGTVRKYKGLDLLLAAMPKVLSEVECQLLVVGEFYDSIEKYRRLIRKLHIENHVHIDNRYVPNEDVPAMFARADVLVLPYTSATQSGVARIALSNGLPIIASRTGGLSDTVSDNVNGLLFPVGDAEKLADCIVTYFSQYLGPVFSHNIMKAQAEGSQNQIADIIEGLGSLRIPQGGAED